MFIDARTLPDRHRIEADLAIIGGGAAGITLARQFAGRRARVCLIESGGLSLDADVQALYDGEIAGLAYPLTGNRLRYFGGSTNHWGGFCRPLEAIDFEVRNWIPDSGWPFLIDELLSYYRSASEVVEIGEPRFNEQDYWSSATGERFPSLRTARLDLSFVQFSPPTRFGQRYREELASAENVQVLLHANVVNIASAGQGRTVTALDLRTLTGLEHRVTARRYVLAAGGLENPRILLLSDRDVPAGLGNHNDRVGRYFMEHPHLSGFGEIVVAETERLPRIWLRRVPVDGREACAAFVPTPDFLRRRRLLNATIMVGEAGRYEATKPAKGANAARDIDMLGAARQLLSATDRSDAASRTDLLGSWLGLGCACEQLPNPDSRVTLSDQRDVLGLRRIRLDWRLSTHDRHSIIEHIRSLALEIGALGIGRMFIDVGDPDGWPEIVRGGAHHMGTTRMHDDPHKGVVDRNCRLHGCDNLYVIGGSVFPTSGAANPTLTIVALTLRLADHLRQEFPA